MNKMVYREKLNQLLADVHELESLIGELLAEEEPGVQLLFKSGSRAYSILEGIKEIENEQIRQMNTRLVERQDELSHLSVLLDQYQRMAEACKKDILATKQEIENSEPLLSQKEEVKEAVMQKEPQPIIEEPVRKEEVKSPTEPVREEPVKEPVQKTAEAPQPAPVMPRSNVSLNDLLEKKNLSDFRKAFSLNDRFRFRRDLFHGNEEQMNQVISDLNQIDSLDKALRFIDKNLSWDMNNETVADFIKLLEKRYI